MSETVMCPICQVEDGVSKHHIIPKSKGGRTTVLICESCHNQIHMMFTNKELKKKLNTIDKLREHPKMAKFIEWKKGKSNIKFKMSNDKKRRGAYS